jgi:purine-binding chemotaxis protein CheW
VVFVTAARLATFHVDGALLGVEVDRVQEVVRAVALTPVPLAPAGIAGLMNLRGQIVSALDLRVRLGLPPRAPDAGAVHVVVHTDDGVVGLVADREGDVVDVDPTALAEVPATAGASFRTYITGVHTLERGVLLVLDIDRAVSLDPADDWEVPRASTGR